MSDPRVCEKCGTKAHVERVRTDGDKVVRTRECQTPSCNRRQWTTVEQRARLERKWVSP